MNNELYNAPNRLILIIDDVEYVIREPFGWKDAEFSIERTKNHGFEYQFPASDLSLKFHDVNTVGTSYSKAKTLIDNALDTFGPDAEISIRLEYFTGGEWLAIDQIELSTNAEKTGTNENAVTILSTSDDAKAKKLKDLFETPVNLYRQDDYNNRFLGRLNPTEVYYHSKVLQKSLDARNTSVDNLDIPISPVNLFDLYVYNSYRSITKDEIPGYVSLVTDSSFTESPIDSGSYILKLTEAGSLTISITDLTIIYLAIIGTSTNYDIILNYRLIGYNISGVEIFSETLATKSQTLTNAVISQSIVVNNSYTYNASVGDEIYAYLQVTFENNSGGTVSFTSDIEVQFGRIQATHLSEIGASIIDSYPLLPTLKKVVSLLTGVNSLSSEFFTNTYPDLYLNSGSILKGGDLGTETAPVLKLKDSLETVDAVFNTGFNLIPNNQFSLEAELIINNSSSAFYNGVLVNNNDLSGTIGEKVTITGTSSNDGTYDVRNVFSDGLYSIIYLIEQMTPEIVTATISSEYLTITLEESAHFYNRENEIIDLTTKDIWDVSEKIATEYIYNTAEFAYPDLRYDEINTIDEFNTRAEYLLSSRKIQNSYTKTSKWKTQGYDIEFLRRQALKTDSTAFKEDKDIYLVQCNPNIFNINISFVHFDDEDVDTIRIDTEYYNKIRKSLSVDNRIVIEGTVSNDGVYTFVDIYLDQVDVVFLEVSETVIDEAFVDAQLSVTYPSTESNEDFETISGVISPETIYNAKLSPARNMLRHATWLNASQHYKDYLDVITNTNYELNGNMISRLENGDLYYDPDRLSLRQNQTITLQGCNQFNHWVVPVKSTFKVNLTFTEFLTIKNACQGGANKYGYIKHKNFKGQTVDSWLLSCKGKPIDNNYTFEVLWWRVNGEGPPPIPDYWTDENDINILTENDETISYV